MNHGQLYGQTEAEWAELEDVSWDFLVSKGRAGIHDHHVHGAKRSPCPPNQASSRGA